MTPTLSSPTLAVLIKIALPQRRTEITTHLLAADLDRFGPGAAASSKGELLQATLTNARQRAQDGDKDAHRALIAFAKELTSLFLDPDEHGPESLLLQLKNALLADGYDLQWEETTKEVEDLFGGTRIEDGPVIYHLRPTDSPGAEMPKEITALEAQLGSAGFDVALNHYQQAVDNLIHHNYEASNGALRTMLEDVILRIADQNGYTGVAKGGAAVNWMVDQKKVVPKSWGRLLQGAWDISHPEGSHPGRSNADEARFRIVQLTSIARRLLQHVEL